MSKNKVSKKKLYKNISLIYVLTSLFFIMGFSFFLTSKMFIAEDIPIKSNELNKLYDLRSNGSFTINEWNYDENKNMMEVVLITEGIKKYDNELNFKAISRVNKKKYLDTNIVYNEDDIYIIHIKNIPKRFEQVAIQIEKQPNSFDAFSKKEALPKKRRDKNENQVSVIYTDQRVVNKEQVIESDFKKYAIDLSQSMIKSLKNSINDSKKEDKKIDINIEVMKEEVTKLSDSKIYQTIEEQIKTDGDIHSLEYQILQLEKEKEKIIEVNLLNEKKIDKLEQKKRDLEIRS